MLSQLAKPTLYNINIFTPEYWFGNYPTTLVLGLFFLALLGASYFLGLNLRHSKTLLIVFFLSCLSFFSSFFLNVASTATADFRSLRQSDDLNLQQSLCQMDATQSLGGIFCAFGHFLIEVKELVPANARAIWLMNSSLTNYASHYFYGHLNLISDPQAAEYLIIFLPQESWSLADDGSLIVSEQGQDLDYGRWQVLAAYHPQIVILRRL